MVTLVVVGALALQGKGVAHNLSPAAARGMIGGGGAIFLADALARSTYMFDAPKVTPLEVR